MASFVKGYWCRGHPKQIFVGPQCSTCAAFKSCRHLFVVCHAAVASVSEGSIAFAIPESEWLTVGAVARSRIGTAISEQESWVQLALYLVFSHALGDFALAGFLEEFQARGLRPVALWSEAGLRQLQGTQAYEVGMQYRQYFQAQAADLEGSVVPTLSPDLQAVWSAEAFVVAASAVRACLASPFSIQDPCTVPAIAAVRHTRTPNCVLGIKESGIFQKSRELQAVAIAPIPAEGQVAVDLDASALESQIAVNFGQYDGAQPRVGYKLTLVLPSEDEDRFHFDKLDILELQGLSGEETFVLERDAAPPANLLAFLRLINICGTDAFLLESVLRNAAWENVSEPVSRENEAAVCQSMVEGCESVVSSHPATLAQTIAALDVLGSPQENEEYVALRLRKDELEVLGSVADWFRARAASLDTLEYYQERRLKRLGLLDDNGRSTFEDMIEINM